MPSPGIGAPDAHRPPTSRNGQLLGAVLRAAARVNLVTDPAKSAASAGRAGTQLARRAVADPALSRFVCCQAVAGNPTLAKLRIAQIKIVHAPTALALVPGRHVDFPMSTDLHTGWKPATYCAPRF